MKLSLNLLQDYIELKADIPTLVDNITEKTAEVDDVEVQGEFLDHCCVGKVTSLSKHPNADRLTCCTVQTDQGEKPVVCGGTNLREGMRVAFAHVGATVKWHGSDVMTLEPVKLRGEPSEGMICAAEELGVEDLYPEATGTNIVDLGDGDESIGTPLKEYFGLNDIVIEIDNHAITHRSDLFSHIGFARELVAMGLASWKKDPELPAPPFGTKPVPFNMTTKHSELMPRYMSCLIEVDTIGTTPDWMKAKLQAAGWRSISLPVDITNYALIEYGLPLHSFDADDIKGNVVMRPAKAGETIVTLDETERELSEGALILEDEEGIFDLLGIMGGLRSSTKESSTKLYVHAASLDQVSIRHAMINMGHRTDAGTVYEKGVQPYIVEQGFYRTIELMLELIPGATLVSEVESVGTTNPKPTIEYNPRLATKKIGAAIEDSFIQTTLEALGFTIETGEIWKITPPLWRGDCTGPHDITEEIARMYGYNSIEPVMPTVELDIPERSTTLKTIRKSLLQDEYLELIPLSLVGPTLLNKCLFNSAEAIEITDPIGEETSVMQPSVLPQLLVQVAEFLSPQEPIIKTHTAAHVFNNQWPEFHQFGALTARLKVDSLLDEPLLTLQQEVSTALSATGLTIEFKPAKTIPAQAHPGRCSEVLYNKEVIGHVFQVHPKVLLNMGIEGVVAACILNIDAIESIPTSLIIGKSLAQFPAVQYDETIPVTMNDSVAEIVNKLSGAHELLESVQVKDLYAKTLPANQYNLTLNFTYRSSSKTLKEADVKEVHEKVLKVLES